jgi:hypothetical protein
MFPGTTGRFLVITIEAAIDTVAHCLRTGQFKKAEEIAQLAFVLATNNANAAVFYGSALLAQGKVHEAMPLLQGVLLLPHACRWHVAQAAIAFLNATTYLEIGVADGATLLQVAASVRIGVDPMPPAPLVVAAMQRNALSYFSMTSDEFFRAPPATVISRGVDVAFVDGLHTYEQSLADVENCLQYLRPGGVIFVHDCNPPSAAIATPATSLLDAKRLNPSGWNGMWTGDVWKTILHLRSCRNDLKVGVLDRDFGIGVIVKEHPDALLPYTPEDIRNFSYSDLEQSRAEFLGLFPPVDLFARLPSKARQCDS